MSRKAAVFGDSKRRQLGEMARRQERESNKATTLQLRRRSNGGLGRYLRVRPCHTLALRALPPPAPPCFRRREVLLRGARRVSRRDRPQHPPRTPPASRPARRRRADPAAACTRPAASDPPRRQTGALGSRPRIRRSSGRKASQGCCPCTARSGTQSARVQSSLADLLTC